MNAATRDALIKLSIAAQELHQEIEKSGYCLSDSIPNFMSDTEDFAYDITSAVDDEINEFYEGDI